MLWFISLNSANGVSSATVTSSKRSASRLVELAVDTVAISEQSPADWLPRGVFCQPRKSVVSLVCVVRAGPGAA